SLCVWRGISTAYVSPVFLSRRYNRYPQRNVSAPATTPAPITRPAVTPVAAPCAANSSTPTVAPPAPPAAPPTPATAASLAFSFPSSVMTPVATYYRRGGRVMTHKFPFYGFPSSTTRLPRCPYAGAGVGDGWGWAVARVIEIRNLYFACAAML